ncbi:hypothetical protein SCLCIDRAFT_145516 [Scleroderma citrinum Foug A]|uniref:Uncharacterized protein n=1 Tax=Scleroderma citrinum Foug A TaxID=1036808 RepID=A0A0C2ZBK8_9AGAM|nr:hypothetical protein SCLCIDRAFT_145516 [Scleroderma citrinum Foug A]
MANDYYWAVIGATNGARVYSEGDWYVANYQPNTLANTLNISPYIQCGSGTPPLPLAIQCKSENKARKVVNTLQPLVNSLLDGADHTQILTTFDNPAIRTLVGDEGTFYAVVIGSPPGIHHTAESTLRAERGFSSCKCRETSSFWITLAFMIVKGNPQDMPPLFTSTTTNANATQVAVDALGELCRSPNTSSLHSALASSSQTSASHTFSTCTLSSRSSTPCTPSFSQDSAVSRSTSIPTRSSLLTCPAEPSPIIYSHVRNLHGILSSNYYPTSTMSIRKSAHSLGDFAASYLTCHGYDIEIVELIINAHRCYSGEQFIMFLAGRGMALNEAKFLLLLIDHGTGANV